MCVLCERMRTRMVSSAPVMNGGRYILTSQARRTSVRDLKVDFVPKHLWSRVSHALTHTHRTRIYDTIGRGEHNYEIFSAYRRSLSGSICIFEYFPTERPRRDVLIRRLSQHFSVPTIYLRITQRCYLSVCHKIVHEHNATHPLMCSQHTVCAHIKCSVKCDLCNRLTCARVA